VQREYPTKELYDYAVYYALERKGKEYDKEAAEYDQPECSSPEIKLDWDGDDKACMANLCPLTVLKWWRHEYFFDL